MDTQGKRVREARKAAKLTQTQLGALCGCSHSAISQIESGETERPKAELMFAIERATGHSAAWMISGKGPKLTKVGSASDPEAAKMHAIYDAILSLPESHRRKIVQDVDFLLSLEKPQDEHE